MCIHVYKRLIFELFLGVRDSSLMDQIDSGFQVTTSSSSTFDDRNKPLIASVTDIQQQVNHLVFDNRSKF
jgi:hypothetical protein